MKSEAEWLDEAFLASDHHNPNINMNLLQIIRAIRAEYRDEVIRVIEHMQHVQQFGDRLIFSADKDRLIAAIKQIGMAPVGDKANL